LPQVKHITIREVMNQNTSLSILECDSEHHGKENCEQEWGQNTALSSAIGDIEV